MNNEILNYQLYTRLPVKLCAKADQMSPVLEVITPHKGVVFIELKKVDKGMFRAATEISRETQGVLHDLYELEREAKDYLLSQWLNPKSNE